MRSPPLAKWLPFIDVATSVNRIDWRGKSLEDDEQSTWKRRDEKEGEEVDAATSKRRPLIELALRFPKVKSNDGTLLISYRMSRCPLRGFHVAPKQHATGFSFPLCTSTIPKRTSSPLGLACNTAYPARR